MPRILTCFSDPSDTHDVSEASFLAHDAGLGRGIVAGDTSMLDEGLSAAIRFAAPTHLSAASGVNN